jgi:hypothetical protein
MSILTAILAVVLLGADAAASDQGAIQGIWRGTWRHERFRLIFCGDVLIGTVCNHPLTGNMESGFRLANGEIDIDRTDGLQRGRYVIEGDKLTLLLANVNRPRPSSIDPPTKQPGGNFHVPPGEQRYEFQRQR